MRERGKGAASRWSLLQSSLLADSIKKKFLSVIDFESDFRPFQ
jgi:hypothetical protein